MAVDLIDATTTIRPKQCSNKHFPGSPIALYSEARYLIIRLPNSKFIKICFRFLLLILALASFQFMIRSSSSSLFNEIISPTSTHHQQKSVSESIDDSNSYSMDTEHVLSILFRDLTNEGLVKKTQQKAVFLCNEDEKPSNVAVNDYNMEHVPLNDLEKQNSVLDNSVDFIYTSNYPAASKFIEGSENRGDRNGSRQQQPLGFSTILQALQLQNRLHETFRFDRSGDEEKRRRDRTETRRAEKALQLRVWGEESRVAETRGRAFRATKSSVREITKVPKAHEVLAGFNGRFPWELPC